MKKSIFTLIIVMVFLIMFTSCPGDTGLQKLSTPVISSDSENEEIGSSSHISITSKENAIIYYTSDGTDPKVSETRKEYKNPFTPILSQKITIKAYATLPGYMDSDVAIKEFTGKGKLNSPVFEFASGSSIPFTEVKINNANGATVYYTLDGTTPSKDSSSATEGAINIYSVDGESVTIKAFLSLEGFEDSDVTEITYSKKKMNKPVIEPESQKFESPITVTISAEEGASVYYTTDGSTPDVQKEEYTGPFVLNDAATVKAIATMEGCIDSKIAVANYTAKTSAPVFSTADGIIPFVKDNFTITADGATIYYTTDGSEPSTSSSYGTSPLTISIEKECIVRAIALKEGYEISEINEIKIKQAQLPAPVINIPDPLILNESEITMECDVDGAQIFYGFYESEISCPYSGPTKITEIGSPNYYAIFAQAKKEGYKDSEKSSENFGTIYERVEDVPVFSLPEGTPNSDNLTLNILSPGTVYYTTDGSEPNMHSSKGDRITLSSDMREIKAMYVDLDKISRTATLNLTEAKDSSHLDGEWIDSKNDYSIESGEITFSGYSIGKLGLSDNNLVISSDASLISSPSFTYSLSGENLTLVDSDASYNLTKSSDGSFNGNDNDGDPISLFLNESSFSLEINGFYICGSNDGSSLTSEYVAMKSDVTGLDLENDPVEFVYGKIYRKPEFRISPEGEEGIAVNEEVEIKLDYTLPSGVSIRGIEYSLNDGVAQNYDSSILYTPQETGSLKVEFTVNLNLDDKIREMKAGEYYSVMDRYGTPYLGPYTVLTDKNLSGDGIKIRLKDYDESSGQLDYEKTEFEEIHWDPNTTVQTNSSDTIKTYREGKYRIGAKKFGGNNLDSIANIKTFYEADATVGDLSGTSWTTSVSLGGYSLDATLAINEDCTYKVQAGNGVLYEGKARYNKEKNLILIDFKNDNKTGQFQSISLQYSYDSSTDTMTVGNTEYYRASGNKGNSNGYWIEKNQEDEIKRKEFVLDGDWISYRGTLINDEKAIYIYEGTAKISDTYITFPTESPDIDNYYILTTDCLSGNTLSVAGLDFTKSN